MSTSTRIALSSLIVSFLALLAIAVALGGVVKENCEGVEELKRVSVESLTRSLNTLPTVDYYRAHPKELEIQLNETRALIRDLQPRDCSVSLFGL